MLAVTDWVFTALKIAGYKDRLENPLLMVQGDCFDELFAHCIFWIIGL